MMKRFIGLTLLTVVTANHVLAQDWSKYKPRSLKQITNELAPSFLKDPDVLITDGKGGSISLSSETIAAQVSVVYVGSVRKLSDKNKELIAAWLKIFGRPPEYLDLFESEYLFTEDAKEYWLPVQKQVASYFQRELQKSDKVNLYVVWIGARKDSANVEHVFLVNEFEKQ